MAQILSLPFFGRLRSEASAHVLRFSGGTLTASGRGLTFWFRRATTSLAELPMDDREMTLFVRGRSRDFQDVTVQGALTWHITDPELLARRIDFSIGTVSGKLIGEPIQQIETRLAGLVEQAVQRAISDASVRALLDAGTGPLDQAVSAALTTSPALAEIGVRVSDVRLKDIAPSRELERALQTPTFEALQQKADEATFERRALAVEKERAIAENEMANRTELARREKALIAEEAANSRDRASATAAAREIESESQAASIRAVETARADAESARMAVYRDLPPAVILGLAARDLAGKLKSIDHVTVTPDLLNSLMSEFRKLPAA